MPVWQYWDQLNVWLETLSYYDWLWVFGVAVAIGVMCMRGFGSRKNY
jgi:hypothetical protein